MEQEPDTSNVVYIDEYPHLAQKVKLRSLGQLALFNPDIHAGQNVLEFPPDPPDSAA